MPKRLDIPRAGPHAPHLEKLPARPEYLILGPATLPGDDRRILATRGEHVQLGQPIAENRDVVLHAPLPGRVESIDGDRIILRIDPEDANKPNIPDTRPDRPLIPAPESRIDPAYLRTIGLVGMGGSMFPASRKLAACLDTNIHTLVVNAVECEPGITIDHALLEAESHFVRRGADALAAATGAANIVLAVQAGPQAESPPEHFADVEHLRLPATYPAGAERLIVGKMLRRPLATGEFPFHSGHLVHNVASLWSLGRALDLGLPVIERPLTIIGDGGNLQRNILAPIGLPFRDLLRLLGLAWDPEKHFLVAGGLMMGRGVEPRQCVTKGTTSLFVVHRRDANRREIPCIRCGACNVHCPLKLHPIGMVKRVATQSPPSAALREQLEACFLCGLCAAVCPSRIPLVYHLAKGKQWIRQHTR